MNGYGKVAMVFFGRAMKSDLDIIEELLEAKRAQILAIQLKWAGKAKEPSRPTSFGIQAEAFNQYHGDLARLTQECKILDTKRQQLLSNISKQNLIIGNKKTILKFLETKDNNEETYELRPIRKDNNE